MQWVGICVLTEEAFLNQCKISIVFLTVHTSVKQGSFDRHCVEKDTSSGVSLSCDMIHVREAACDEALVLLYN